MHPKNLQIFILKSNELINEIAEILNIQNWELKTLQLRKNEFRDKCLQFLKVSFDSFTQNDYFIKFESIIYEVSQNAIYLDRSRPNPSKALIEIEYKQFEHAKSLLLSFINNCKFIDTVICELPTGINEQGLFFKGQYYDATFKLVEIVRNAKIEIKVVDNYINEDLINFLQKDTQVKIKIITSDRNAKQMKQLRLILKSISSQYGNLEIRENNNFHDRFIILDDNHAYHFGASLKQLADKTFMFTKIQQQSILDAIIDEFEKAWNVSLALFP